MAAAEVRDKYTQTGENFNLAFKMCSRKNPSFNILWCGSAMRATQMRNIQPWQRLNQFPRSTELTRKDKLYDNIARSAAIFGDAFSFIPEFFVTPRDASLLETAMEHSMTDFTFIVKPVSSSRGQGIFFASTAEEIPRADTLLVSRYVENPLLVNGHKFDLRIYVAVTSFYPLIVYVYSEGLTRVASEKYRSEVDSRDAFVHLTNYSINKNNSNFVRNESMASEDFGHKWTLGALLRHLEKDRIDSKRTNFELFGFDILVDAELKPWLLEVNLSPSLSCDAPLDSLVKTRLICDLFNLACVPLVNRKLAGIETVRAVRDESYDSDEAELMSEKNRKIISPTKRGITTKRRRPMRNAFTTMPGGNDPSMRFICRRARAEMSRRGGFVRIFPREGSLALYRSVMERVGSEKRDERLYLKEYGLDEDVTAENEDERAHLYHEVMMNSELRPIGFLLGSTVRAASRKGNLGPKDGETYAARLPVVRPSARLRTKSCSEWYEVKKATLAEAKLKLRLQQEELQLEEQRGRENKENASPPTYPSLESVPPRLYDVLREWHSSANAYTQRITKDGETYAARLPVVRPSARLRTKSCSEWYEVKKATLAEAKLKLRLQQEELQLEDFH
ncbi:Tubulin-tyrosine ligase family protein, partial [Cooperia oncophora]